MGQTYKILILSGISPFKSANLGKDQIDALSQAGHEVVFLTKYKFDGMSDNMHSVYDFEEPEEKNGFQATKVIKTFLKKYFRYWIVKIRNRGDHHLITTDDESISPVPTDLLISKVEGCYDFILTLFWHNFINASTLKALYERFKCPIIIQSADMGPMTGGCYYYGDCKNYSADCNNCPADSHFSRRGQANRNFLFKKKVYSEINCAYTSNRFVCKAVLESGIIDKDRVKIKGAVINEKVFCPIEDIKGERALLSLPQNDFIIFAGATNIDIPRKGFDKLVEAVNMLPESIEGKAIILVLAGKVKDDITKLFNKPVIPMGYLNLEELAKMYAISDVYLSPSIDDAGPSMVNQSLMCGTPVVSFDIGVAQELVTNGEDGYRAPNKDSASLSEGLSIMLHRMLTSEPEIRNKCREVAMHNNSFKAYSDRVEEIYNELKNNG